MTQENKIIIDNLIKNSEDSNENKVTLSDELISMIISFIIPSFDIKSIKYFNGENNNFTLLIVNLFEYLKILKLFNTKSPIKNFKNVYIDVFIFMKLQNTEVIKISKIDIFKEIIYFVRKEKQSNNPDIFVHGDNRRFRLIGNLKILFNFFKHQMITRGDLENSEDFPEHIAYTDIFKYIKYCFSQN
jgi:hypothetical protein